MTRTADPWQAAKAVIGSERVTLGAQASQQWRDAPEHLGMVIHRYRVASALIGGAQNVVELGAGEGIGTAILDRGRRKYLGLDSDREAIAIAREQHTDRAVGFQAQDVVVHRSTGRTDWDAVVTLDVIEHISPDEEVAFMASALSYLGMHGVMVVGTPSANAEHLASPQSKIGHVNLYTPGRLRALMARYFHTVQMLYSQGTDIHIGHSEMAHYLFAVGIGPKTGGD